MIKITYALGSHKIKTTDRLTLRCSFLLGILVSWHLAAWYDTQLNYIPISASLPDGRGLLTAEQGAQGFDPASKRPRSQSTQASMGYARKAQLTPHLHPENPNRLESLFQFQKPDATHVCALIRCPVYLKAHIGKENNFF